MVRIELDFENKKATMIDDAEGTPGMSRQYTRFRQYCLPDIEKGIKKLSVPLTKEATDKFVTIIKDTCSAHMFAYKTGDINNNKLMLFAETVDNQEDVL